MTVDGNLPVLRRVLRWLASPFKPFVVALVPDRYVGPEVLNGRYGWPLLTAIACACIAAIAFSSQLDVGPEVRAENVGDLANPAELKTDREIDEMITQRAAIIRVKLGAGALAGTSFRALGLAFALLLLARFVGGKPTMPRMLAVASLAAIPGAVRSLIVAIVAARQPSLASTDFEGLVQFPLVPDGPVLSRLLDGVDVFTWWSVIVIGFGLSAGAEIKRRKGFIAVAVGFLLYLLVTRLIMAGDVGPPPGANAT